MSVLRFMCLAVLLVALSGVPAFATDEEPSDPSETGTMGQVLLGAIASIDGENYQIRNEDGATIQNHVSKETKLNDSDFKAGDHVIGSVTAEGHVLALTKRSSAKVGA